MNDSSDTAASSSSDSTRDRVVAAAREAFARDGIAGARVDAIAREAHTSKERVYAYFRGKETLYEFVSAQEMNAVAEATQLDATDLPGYAGRVFDYFEQHPERFRITSWGRLEVTPAKHPDPENPTHASTMRKIDRIRRAQAAGQLDPSWDPLDVLAIVNQLATAWMMQVEMHPFISKYARDPSSSARRAAVVAAVERLFPAYSESKRLPADADSLE
ncbi:TetR family transcriptional regulator [Rhodococcus koreensis]